MPHLFSLRPPRSQHWKSPTREECSSSPSRASTPQSLPDCPERCFGTPKPHCVHSRGEASRNHPAPHLVVPSRPGGSHPTALGKAHHLTSAFHGKEGTSAGAEPLHWLSPALQRSVCTYLCELLWARETSSSLRGMCPSGTTHPLFSSAPNMVMSLFLPTQGCGGAQHQTGQGSR